MLTHKASKELGYPSVVDFIADACRRGLVSSVHECWPHIDDGCVETLRSLKGGSPHGGPNAGHDAQQNVEGAIGSSNRSDLTDEAIAIIRKFANRDWWSRRNPCPVDGLGHIFKHLQDWQDVLDELVRDGWMIREEHLFWLNAGRKLEIESAIENR